MLPPTFNQVSRVVKLIASLQSTIKLLPDGYKTDGQREAARFICDPDHDQTVLQMYRRSGKTHIVAVIGAIYIIQGENVIVGSPTLSQSSRLLFKEVAEIVDILFSVLGGCRRVRDSLTYITWDNGASLLALTANPISKQQEGYGGALLLIDESHRIDVEILPVLLPSIDDAVEAGIGKVVILGVGGHKTKLIEWIKKQEGWTSYKYKASMETNLSKQVIFDKARATHSDIWYDQHYECMPCHEGLRLCYPIINDRIDTTRNISLGMHPRHFFGIDIGKVDETVVCVIEKVGEVANIVDHFSMSGRDHIPIAKEVYRFINKYAWAPERIIVEHNSVGTYFQDTLISLGMNTRTINTTEDFKDGVWHSSSVAMKNNKLGIEDKVMAEKLGSITYSIKENGHLNIEHSDYWSAFSMAYGGLV